MYDAMWTGNYAVSYSTDTVRVFLNNSSLPKVRLSYVVLGRKGSLFYLFICNF
jgi:hypothetical protein